MSGFVRSRWAINTKPLDDLAEFAADIGRIAGDLGETAFTQIEDGFLDELRYYPAPPPNSTYVRTFTLRDGWTLSLDRTADGFSVVVNNSTRYAKYVVGSLAKARAAAAKLQARIHQGRWPLAHDTAEFWFEAFFEVYNDLFAKELGRFGVSSVSRRAFTR